MTYRTQAFLTTNTLIYHVEERTAILFVLCSRALLFQKDHFGFRGFMSVTKERKF